jgi:hypothetical protein
METTIYGLKDIIINFSNWFTTPITIVLFILINALLIYYFYKLNFVVNDDSIDSSIHYLFNLLLITPYLIIIFGVGHYIIINNLLSIIITCLFYSATLFILVLFLIFLRRYKIKKWIIQQINNINNTSEKNTTLINKLKKLISFEKHDYLEMLLKDLNKKKKIDINKYKKLNIFENKNRIIKNN